MVRDLPGLIDESVQAVHTSAGEEQRLAYECLAGTFRCVFTVAWNFGYIDLATVALDRLAWAAPARRRAGPHCTARTIKSLRRLLRPARGRNGRIDRQPNALGANARVAEVSA